MWNVLRSLSLLLVLAPGLAACKAPKKQCQEVCTRFATLGFWEEANIEIGKAPPADRDALRVKQTDLLQGKLVGADYDMCVSQCQSANNEDDNECVLKARDFAIAKACLTQKRSGGCH